MLPKIPWNNVVPIDGTTWRASVRMCKSHFVVFLGKSVVDSGNNNFHATETFSIDSADVSFPSGSSSLIIIVDGAIFNSFVPLDNTTSKCKFLDVSVTLHERSVVDSVSFLMGGNLTGKTLSRNGND